MFKKDLQDKLSKIFGMPVSYNAPSESYEQDTMFVEIQEAFCRTTQGKQIAKVMGNLAIYSQNDKFPFGFINKRVQQADFQLTKNLFLFDVDTVALNSPAQLVNVAERRARFVYLYSAQYDPNQGTLTNVEFGG